MNPLFSVGLQDFAKGIVVAVLSGVVAYIYGVANTGSLNVDLHQVAVVAVASALGYVVKNYLSDSQGKFGGVI